MIPGLRRSSGEGKGYPLQYSGLENSMDCIVHGVAKSQDTTEQLSFSFHKSNKVQDLDAKNYKMIFNKIKDLNRETDHVHDVNN